MYIYNTHARAHTHTHTHLHIHIIHTHTHTHTHTHLHIHTFVHIHTATLPDVEHDEERGQFVVKLSSFAANAGVDGGDGGEGGQEEKEGDLALLTYNMRKWKGELVILRVGVCMWVRVCVGVSG